MEKKGKEKGKIDGKRKEGKEGENASEINLWLRPCRNSLLLSPTTLHDDCSFDFEKNAQNDFLLL